MKKSILIWMMALVLCLAGCGANKEKKNIKNQAENILQESEEESFENSGEGAQDEGNENTSSEQEGEEAEGSTQEEPEITEPEREPITVEEYYDRAVFIGDSIMEGYRLHAPVTETSPAYLSDFLTAKSYTTVAAMSASGRSCHPKFQGKNLNVWEAMEEMEIDRAFLMFGANDLVGRGPQETFDNLMLLITTIRENLPEIEIHIVSMTPTYPGAGKGTLNHDGVHALNNLLRDHQEECDYSYVDICSALEDEDGMLPKEYCSDEYVHLRAKAYEEIWDPVLFDYATAMIEAGKF